MKKRSLGIGLGFLLAATTASAQVVAWDLDPTHSEVGFKVRHLGLSNVRGRFKKFSATIRADAKTGKLASVEATAQVKSIDTGIEKRDNHLKANDFFDAGAFPIVKFKTRGFKWTGTRFTAEVDMTIRDKTLKVEFQGEQLGVQKLNLGDGEQLRSGYTATATIDRKQFGLRFNALAEGVAIVGREVTIELEIATTRKL